MNEIFGVSMNAIMGVLLAAFGVCVAGVALVFVSNRIMFRMGLRNVRRRRAQSILVVFGLMLATIIITAAFTTGDSIDYSVTSTTYENLQRTDISLHGFRDTTGTSGLPDDYTTRDNFNRFEQLFANDPEIDGMMPFLFETLPVLNPSTRLAEPRVIVAGFDAEAVTRFGGLRYADGGRPDLAALKAGEILVGERAAGKLDARVGQVITVYTQSGEHQLTVAGIVKDERSSGALEFGGGEIPSMAVPMATLQQITGHDGQINSISVVLRGSVRESVKLTDVAAEHLEAFKNDRTAQQASGLSGFTYQVEKNKQDAVEAAVLIGNVFTTMFVVMGMFSISAGVLLIFMIFVMLAAERMREMGIARAVGATRANLVQSFVAEGLVYDIFAGIVGVVLGIAAAFVLVIGGMQLVAGDELSFMQSHVTARSLTVSFTLGAVLTFATVVVSSVRISQLNIVTAIRGGGSGERKGRDGRGVRWRWLIAGVVMTLIIPPLGIYWLLRKAFGIPWAWIIGPAGLVGGCLLIWAGQVTNQSFFLTLGVSLLPIAGGAIARTMGVPGRPAWSTAGGLLAIYWLLPFDPTAYLFGKVTGGGMEMFVLSGIMIVIGFTLVIVYNARLLTALSSSPRGATIRRYRTAEVLVGLGVVSAILGLVLSDVGDGLGQLFYLLAGFLGAFALLAFAAVRFPVFAPALKMGVAYPLANRFRTGMTIAMFSLVVFSITVMAIVNASFLQLFASDEGRAGWDIEAITNRNMPVDDFPAALAGEGSFDPSAITASGRLSGFEEQQKVRQVGHSWTDYPVRAADTDYWTNGTMALESRAIGYTSDRAVFDAVRDGKNLAIIDSLPMQGTGYNFGTGYLTVKGVKIEDHAFEPFDLEVRDPVTGKTETVTVIGVLSGKIPANLLFGVITNEATYTAVYSAPEYTYTYLRLAADTDAKAAAKGIKAALVTRGVQATSIQEQIDDAMNQSRGFLRVFQAFMGLGLFVGIAALGVIALRSVVERRQQIGMLRAIGYQRGTVALSFILESGFIAATGVLSGVVGAAILSWRILTSDEMQTNQAVDFYMPWIEILVYIALAMGFALLMTWWPSRRAARVPIAEALRYE